MTLNVYLAGEIHSDWREEFKAAAKDLDLTFLHPQTDHDLSDNIGEEILGDQPNAIYKDKVASDVNNFRTTILLNKADVVVARFGEKYKQWNTAMDATTAIQKGIPLIIIRDESLHHGLKELSNKANVTVETIEQAVAVLAYVFK